MSDATSEIYEIADALTAAVQAVLPDGITAQRVYVPLKEETALDELTVFVCPQLDAISPMDRDRNWEELTFDVGVMQRLQPQTDPTSPSANPQIDPLVKLCRAIALLANPGQKFASAQWLKTELPLVFDVESLRENRIYLGVITFTCKQ